MGDLLLRQVAEQLTRAGGMNSTAYRFGGDEFALLIPARSGREIDAIIHKVQNVFAEPWLIENQEYYCTMSMGVVYFPHDGEDVMTLLKRADIALRTAKHDGKNRTERFNETLPGTSTRRLDMEHAMRRAVEAIKYSNTDIPSLKLERIGFSMICAASFTPSLPITDI